MEIRTQKSKREIEECIVSMGFSKAKDRGYEIRLKKKKNGKLKNSHRRIHIVFTSSGIDIHRDSEHHKVVKHDDETIRLFSIKDNIIKQIEKLHISQSETSQMNESVKDFSEKLLGDFKRTVIDIYE